MKSMIKQGDKMIKIFKKIFMFVLSVFIVFMAFLFCVGNYLYDYTLNPHSSKNIGEKIKVNQDSINKNQQWLDDNTQVVSMQSYDDLKLNGYYADNESDIYIIMVHGYRSDATSVVAPAKKMIKEGYNVLIPDLRGHGKSEGDFIGMGWIDHIDILDWIDMIIKKNQQAQIVLYGISMGGATVMNVAGDNPPKQVKAIIEDCGYTNVWDVLYYHLDEEYGWSKSMMFMAEIVTYLRAGYCIKDASPLEQVKNANLPILFIHGDNDEFVPFSMLDQLYENAGGPKEKLVIKGGSHANNFAVNPELYYSTICEFIKKYV